MRIDDSRLSYVEQRKACIFCQTQAILETDEVLAFECYQESLRLEDAMKKRDDALEEAKKESGR